MPKILICYYSKTGHTEEMAQLIAGAAREEGCQVELAEAEQASPEDLLAADGLILGSPTYYGQMAAQVKKLIDESVRLHGRLDGKVGGAFTSSGGLGGGNETTIRGLLDCLMVHGMIIQGDPKGDHYGPIAVGPPDERSRAECQRFGRRVAALVKKLAA